MEGFFIKRNFVIILILISIFLIRFCCWKGVVSVNSILSPVFRGSGFYFKVFESSLDTFDDYLLKLSIPGINLEERVYDINSSSNDVDRHIKILKDSSIQDNVFFLAGHSGNGGASYFNDLVKLSKGDIVVIEMYDKKLYYAVDNFYYIEKTGYLEISNELENVLFLITCSLNYPNQQLVVVAYLT